MPSVMRNIIAILLLFFAGQSISAQQEVILDHVTNSIGDSLLIAGNTHIISIRYRNFATGACLTATYNPNSGFKLFSPDGAAWNKSLGTVTTEFVDLGWTQVIVNHFEDPSVGGDNGGGPNDGVSPDYLGFFATIFFVSPSFALQSGFDNIVFQIEIETNLADTGLQICIDSSSVGRLNKWQWSGIARAECNVAPDWGGPFCFTIVAPTCGDANSDGQLTDSDLSVLIEYYFGFGPTPPLGTGDVNSDGTIDITDIIYLANYLHNGGPAPCPGTGPGGFDWKDKPDSRQAGND